MSDFEQTKLPSANQPKALTTYMPLKLIPSSQAPCTPNPGVNRPVYYNSVMWCCSLNANPASVSVNASLSSAGNPYFSPPAPKT